MKIKAIFQEETIGSKCLCSHNNNNNEKNHPPKIIYGKNPNCNQCGYHNVCACCTCDRCNRMGNLSKLYRNPTPEPSPEKNREPPQQEVKLVFNVLKKTKEGMLEEGNS